MPLSISAQFAFESDQPIDVLLQFEAAQDGDQRIISSKTDISSADQRVRVAAHDDIGERIWLRTQGHTEVCHTALAEALRETPALDTLGAVQVHRLPARTVKYLLDSRYCPSVQFQDFVYTTFADTTGGERVAAIRDWVSQNITYTPGNSTPETDAVATFHSGHGVCRDFAHLVVTLARASTIPARYTSCYATGVKPQDFHAVAEVFLSDPRDASQGKWYIVDATGMADPGKTVRIGVGRDATDVSFMTTFGPNQFLSSHVEVREA